MKWATAKLMGIGKRFRTAKPENPQRQHGRYVQIFFNLESNWRVESVWRVACLPVIQQSPLPQINSDLANCNFDFTPRSRVGISRSEEPIFRANFPERRKFHRTISVQAPAYFKICSIGFFD